MKIKILKVNKMKYYSKVNNHVIIFFILFINYQFLFAQNAKSNINDNRSNYETQIVYNRYYFLKNIKNFNKIKYELPSYLKIFNTQFGDLGKKYSKDSLYFQFESYFKNDTLKVWCRDSLIYKKAINTISELSFADHFVYKYPNHYYYFSIQMNNGKKIYFKPEKELLFIKINHSSRLNILEVELTNEAPFYY